MRIKKIEERWFDVPNDPDKARIKIKHLLPGEVADLFEEEFDQNIKYNKNESGELEPVISQTPNKKNRKLTLTKVVLDWENIFDLDGKPLKCNNKNILRASREIEGFDELIAELRTKLSEDVKQEQDDQAKN